MKKNIRFSPVEEIVKEIKLGRMVVLTDDEARENEGDLVMAGQFATSAKINFMAKYGRGLICSPLEQDRARALNLFQMERENSDPFKTNWLISVDASKGVTTGISAADRARTIKVLSDPASVPAPAIFSPSRPAPAASWPAPGIPRPAPTW